MPRKDLYWIFLFFSFILLLSVGCESNTYSLKVDAIHNPEIGGHKSYAIVSSNPEVNSEDVAFKEVEEYVKTALSGKGLYEAPNADSADMIVEVAFGMGDPKVEFKTYDRAIVAMVGGGYRTAVIDYQKTKTGDLVPIYGPVRAPRRYEVIGHEERTVPYTAYEKYLRITARDNNMEDESEGPVQVWSVYVKNKDKSDDLRKYLPVMAAASIAYVGETTERQEEIKLKGTDSGISFVKEGM